MSSFLFALALSLPLQSSATPAAAPAQATPASVAEDPAVTALALKMYMQMRAGKVDATLVSPQMYQALTAAVTQQKPVFDQLGAPTSLIFQSAEKLPQGNRYNYLATFPSAQLHVQIFIDHQGKVGGYFLRP